MREGIDVFRSLLATPVGPTVGLGPGREGKGIGLWTSLGKEFFGLRNPGCIYQLIGLG